jgi:sulfatase-like protein
MTSTLARPMTLTARLPTLAAWLRRPAADAVQGAYLVLLSAGLTAWLAWTGPVEARALASIATAFAQVVLAAGGAAVLLRTASRGRLSSAASLVASTTVVLAWVGADRLHVVVFGDHLDRARLGLLYEALRSRAVKPDVGLLAALVGAAIVIALMLRALLVALTYLPGRERLAQSAARLRAPIAAALALLVLADPGGAAGDALRAPLPWSHNQPTAKAVPPPDATSPLDGAEERLFARLERDRGALLGGPLSAHRRPSIVILHAESVRFDMMRGDVMPNTLRLSKECLSPRHHYSTSNNTGSGMFGILAGLPVSYYALARRDGAKPLPLQILKKLGYSLSAYYSSYLSTYDGLCDLFFKGVVDSVDEERDPRPDVADAAIVEHYLAALAKRDPREPTFDYLVFESSHYDYAYPPEFEKFVPTATLGTGIRDGIVRRQGINDELKPLAPLIRNRYQNSILWTDSLIQRIVAAWASRRDDVVLVVTGDHGEAFWEHGTFGHGLSLSDDQVRVPLVMCLPGAPATRYAYSSHADIFATIFDFMGLEAGGVPFMAGKSLLRYDAARDLAVFGYGLTGSLSDERLAAAGDGLKVVFVNRTPLSTISVSLDGDIELPAQLPADVEARVADLKLRAVDARILR